MLMKRIFILVALLVTLITTTSAQQLGASKPLALEDNAFVGMLWEPYGTIKYTEKEGVGAYGFSIWIKTNDDYLDIEKGHKVSFEFTDGTRELSSVLNVSTNFTTKIVNNAVVSIYHSIILTKPNVEDLTRKQIKRIVLQRLNGKVYIIEPTPRRSKKLLTEIGQAMKEAVQSFKTKVANDNYFSE